jgi:hypothetical protein
MTITTTHLSRAAGIGAVVAGAIFIGVQIGHPPLDVSSVDSTGWLVRSCAKLVMAALMLAGITAMYLRQVRRSGWLGLLGYLLFAAGYLVMFSVEAIAAFVVPTVAKLAPDYVNDILAAAGGGSPAGDICGMTAWFATNGITYLVGGLLFGIALFRARVLARWAAVLLAVGTVATLALAVLPESFNRPLAVPTGVAFIGLGVSLWRDLRTPAPAVTVAQTVGAAR